MVVMEFIEHDYARFDLCLPPCDGTRKQLDTCLASLHEAGYVHGDVRDVNILVKKFGKPGVMLVDFDWSGKIGEAVYPPNVNTIDVWRPDGAEDGREITVDHDLEMLEAIYRCL